jgi:ERCC4-related helicase
MPADGNALLFWHFGISMLSLQFDSLNKKTVFLVNSVPLVTQQKDFIQRHLGSI